MVNSPCRFLQFLHRIYPTIIRVDIDGHLFPQGQPIAASTTVEIVGEVDADVMKTTEIDVDALRIVQ